MKFILYKIYYHYGLIYLGRTKQNLQTRLHGHFFKKPMHREIDIGAVVKIEYAEFQTEADMFLYEIYYINKLKPPLNRDDKASDELTVDLPVVEFKEFECKLMDKWKDIIKKQDEEKKLRKKEQQDNLDKLIEMRRQARNGKISEDEYFDFKEGIN